MKKKIVILALCLAVLMALFCSCDLSQLRGENGLSAYEIAVKNGFEGTEEEWNTLVNTSYHCLRNAQVNFNQNV